MPSEEQKRGAVKPLALEAYVYIWLPGEIKPVVAGKLEVDGPKTTFIYGQSYLGNKNAISISEFELPLRRGKIDPIAGLPIAGAIRDAAPDSWGRRVILNRTLGQSALGETEDPFNELTYLLESGSDRIGALDFQANGSEYLPRTHKAATLEELLSAAERIDNGFLLTPELDEALKHGTSIGGARPKALIDTADKKYIAKFSSSSDSYSVVKTEFIAMRLAHESGINVAQVKMAKALGKDVVLVERFDRIWSPTGYQRRSLISSLSLLGLNDMVAHYASYKDITDIIRRSFRKPTQTLEELFKRLVFNVLISNNDDHARNHAALWDGKMLELSPAYDLCPQKRTGREANQAMYISGQDKRSRLETIFAGAKDFLLPRARAIEIAEELMTKIVSGFNSTADESEATEVDVAQMKFSQFFNDYAFEDLAPDASPLLLLKKTL